MANQPEDLLDAVVRHHVGPGTHWSRYDRKERTALNSVLDVAERMMSRDFALYWVDGGLPENFSLPSFDPPLIIFSTRYVEMVGYLRNLMTSPLLSGSILDKTSERISLKIMAELLLKYGDPGTACYLFAQSLLGERFFVRQPSALELDFERRDWAYMTMWYYAVLHELGHINLDGHELSESDQDALENTLKRVVERLGMSDAWFGDANRRGLVEDFDKRLLGEEIKADNFARRIMSEAAPNIIGHDERVEGCSPADYAGELIVIRHITDFMDRCARAAQIAANQTLDKFNIWRQIIVSSNARFNHIAGGLALVFATAEHNPPGENLITEWFNKIMAVHEDLEARWKPLNQGNKRAMLQTLIPGERQVGVYTSLAEMIKKSPLPILLNIEIKHFCKFADALAVYSPDVELLRSLSERPADPIALVKNAARNFFVLWVSDHYGGRPLCLFTKHENLIFAFHDLGPRWDEFVTVSAGKISHGVKVREKAITATSACEAAAVILQDLPNELRLRSSVIVEGTRIFELRFQELVEGTIWADNDPGFA